MVTLRIDRLVRAIQQIRWSTANALGRNTHVPMVLHVTHYKAGSQWVANLLKHCVPFSRFVHPQQASRHFSQAVLKPGAVIPAIYLARAAVEKVTSECPHPLRCVVVIRDLRDTLVSQYFSLRYSHEEHLIRESRKVLSSMDSVEGMRWVMSHPLSVSARIQSSWIDAEDRLLVRYENLVADEHAEFGRILDYCNIRMDPTIQRSLIAANSFSERTGRSPGEEDIMSHQRKGIVGDWRNHFTPELKDEFKARFGRTLIETGYESGLDW